MIIDPHPLVGQALVPKAIAKDDIRVSIDGLVAGRIMLRPAAFGASRWFWTITGPAMVQAGLPSSGEAGSIEEARVAFREAFDRWLAWALEAPEPVRWLGGAARASTLGPRPLAPPSG